jgi:hypothetical protein
MRNVNNDYVMVNGVWEGDEVRVQPGLCIGEVFLTALENLAGEPDKMASVRVARDDAIDFAHAILEQAGGGRSR